jgi:hypothetical protein
VPLLFYAHSVVDYLASCYGSRERGVRTPGFDSAVDALRNILPTAVHLKADNFYNISQAPV